MKSYTAFDWRRCFGLATAILLLLAATPAVSQTEISLTKTFVEKYKNQVTIDTQFIIDKAHAHPNSAAKDGDMHVAGRSPASSSAIPASSASGMWRSSGSAPIS